jgi:predicted nucleic acid-binding Zn ribbon protein
LGKEWNGGGTVIKKELKHIDELIKTFFKTRNWSQRIDGYSLFSSWQDILPPKIACNTKPIKIQNNTLFIFVKNHIWANEIRIRKDEIIDIINKEAGQEQIEDVIIKINSKMFNNKNI